MTVFCESLFTSLFPSDCRICSTPLTNVSRLPVCAECLAEIQPISGKLCDLCGERLPGLHAAFADERARCPICRKVRPPYAQAVAYGSYDGELRELVHLLKYGGVRPAATSLGRMLAEAIRKIEPSLGGQPVLLIPVPLHRSKRRQRQFNQAESIARAAMKFLPPGRLVFSADILERRRATLSQIGLTSHQRRENMRGAFAVNPRSSIKDAEILLVDDVLTTGTTVSECARVLLRAGASKVWVATVARTLKHEAQILSIEPAPIHESMNLMAAAG